MNEARNLTATLATIQNKLNIEVIVVDGGSSDDTVQVAHSYGVKVLFAPLGRACQMNIGAKSASGDILLFLHADTHLPANFETMVAKVFATESNLQPVAGAFELRINLPRLSLRLIEIGVKARSHWLQMPYGDQAIFLKSSLFYDIGGFPDLPIMEDFELMLRLKRLGRIAIIPVPVLTSGRRWQKLGVLKTTLINQAAIIAYLMHIPTPQIASWYRQH